MIMRNVPLKLNRIADRNFSCGVFVCVDDNFQDFHHDYFRFGTWLVKFQVM